jgi:ribosomal protein L11
MRIVSLIVPAAQAQVSPPIGPVLGQLNISAKDFCDHFNYQSQIFPAGLLLRVLIFVTGDKSNPFVVKIKGPTTIFLLGKLLKESESKLFSFCFYKLSIFFLLFGSFVCSIRGFIHTLKGTFSSLH